MLADPAGGCTVVLRPLYDLIRAHLFARCRVPGDDTPLPVLAKDKTATGRAWAYVRDDQRFGERKPRAAMFFYSRSCAGDHLQRHLNGHAGTHQVDAYAGFNYAMQAEGISKRKLHGSRPSSPETLHSKISRRSENRLCPQPLNRLAPTTGKTLPFEADSQTEPAEIGAEIYPFRPRRRRKAK